jgi:hypothetical protein
MGLWIVCRAGYVDKKADKLLVFIKLSLVTKRLFHFGQESFKFIELRGTSGTLLNMKVNHFNT